MTTTVRRIAVLHIEHRTEQARMPGRRQAVPVTCWRPTVELPARRAGTKPSLIHGEWQRPDRLTRPAREAARAAALAQGSKLAAQAVRDGHADGWTPGNIGAVS